MKKLILIIATIITVTIKAKHVQPIPIGNFALPTAMQPSPLFSFGQNIVDAHDALGYVNPIYIKGKNKKFFLNELDGLYGLSDEASLFIQIPAPVINKENNLTSSGFGDVIFQGEYAYFDKTTESSVTQATVVGSIYLPSGILEVAKQGPEVPEHLPFTGLGSTTFFLGGTAQRTTINWYMFTSVGGLITTTHNQTKLGNNVLYQFGLGRNITHLNDQIFLLVFELDGIYAQKDKLLGFTDPNSGGNTIYFGPALYYANKRLIFQAGIQTPVFQKLNGIQTKISYQISISVAWLFNHDDYDLDRKGGVR
jgi:hypothetical protein